MIQQYLSEVVAKIEKWLAILVPEIEASHAPLYQAARYSLLGAGKRIRPALMLAAAETLGGSVEHAIAPACALEIIHTYSMIHDDLPCMDNDDFRRGKPTLHKAYSEGIATLAGDLLLTRAFELLANAEGLTAEQKVQLIKILAARSGGEGMIAGQFLDLEAEKTPVSLAQLQQIHSKKTGEMITAALEMGAICAQASAEHRQILASFGNDIGFAFQIIDDVLDTTASKAKHGREISSDQLNGKTTYVTLLGIEESTQAAERLLEQALLTVKKLPFDTHLLAELAKMLVRRKI